MSRSGYNECDDGFNDWSLIKYRGQVISSMRGKRGMEFLRELREALDALPEKKLIAHELQNKEGGCCAIGAVGKLRGIDMTEMDAETMTEDGVLSKMFNIANQMVREIEWTNDDEYNHWFADEERDPETGFPLWDTVEKSDGRTVRESRKVLNKHGVPVDRQGRTKESWETSKDLVRWGRVSQWVNETIKATELFRAKKGWEHV